MSCASEHLTLPYLPQAVWYAKVDISGSNQGFPSCRGDMQKGYEIFSKLSVLDAEMLKE